MKVSINMQTELSAKGAIISFGSHYWLDPTAIIDIATPKFYFFVERTCVLVQQLITLIQIELFKNFTVRRKIA